MLIRLVLMYGLSGQFEGTPEDFTCVMEDLAREFSISEDDIETAIKGSELLGELWKASQWGGF
jgi:hypothetical protein